MRPTMFLEMEEQEKAFVVAAIEKKIENDKMREKEIKRQQKSARKGRR